MAGVRLALIGRNAAGDWLVVCCIEERPGWVAARLVRTETDIAGLPVGLPPPAPPTATPLPTLRARDAVADPLSAGDAHPGGGQRTDSGGDRGAHANPTAAHGNSSTTDAYAGAALT